MIYLKTTLIILFSLIIITGCSGVSDVSLDPVTAPQNQEISGEFPVGVSDYFANGKPAAGMGMLGLFEVNIDPVGLSAEIHPVRQTSLTDVLETVDITVFLQNTPCTDCVILDSLNIILPDEVSLSIGIKHPFPAGNPIEPISGRNRADLHVFNVEGILISSEGAINFPGLANSIADFKLLSADGYTGYLDEALDDIFPTDANLHPYVLHFDDYSEGNYDPSSATGFTSVTDPPPSGNLVMAMGSDYDYQDYIFKLGPNERISFRLAVGCTYAVSAAIKSERFSPEYRVPQHNKKAASEIAVSVTRNELVESVVISSADIEIHVVDFNHGADVGEGLDMMVADSSVSGIRVDIPGVLATALNVDISSPTGTGHAPSDPLVYSATITNSASGGIGAYNGLVKVTDSYPPGLNSNPILAGMDGIERVDPTQSPLEGLFGIPEFATYQVFTLDVFPALPPAVPTGIDPNHGYVDDLLDDVDITGTDFHDGCTVELEYGVGDSITATDVVVIDSEHITADFDLTGTTLGLYDLIVTNLMTSPGILADAFTVIESGLCPYAPNAAYDYTTTPTTESGTGYYAYIHTNDLDETPLDVDMLHTSTNDLIFGLRDGYNQIRSQTPHYSGYPVGTILVSDVEVCSIDVTTDDKIVYVTFDDSVLASLPVQQRWSPKKEDIIPGLDTEFHVYDITSSAEIGSGFDVGAGIQAVELDANDDIWVIDVENVMHKFEYSAGTYTENTIRAFDMDINGSNMQGNVYDFVIDFYNEAFYILTDATDYGYLYRVECDGVFNASIEGNPNPLEDIWDDTGTGRADIVIDNFDSAGNILTGDQDAQILCLSTVSLPPPYFPTTSKNGLTRVNAALDNAIYYQFAGGLYTGYGVMSVAMNGRSNIIWVKDGVTYGNEHIVHEYHVPSGWQ